MAHRGGGLSLRVYSFAGFREEHDERVSRGWFPPRAAMEPGAGMGSRAGFAGSPFLHSTIPPFTLWLSRWEGGVQPTEAARADYSGCSVSRCRLLYPGTAQRRLLTTLRRPAPRNGRAIIHDDLAPQQTASASKREALPTPLKGTIMQ